MVGHQDEVGLLGEEQPFRCVENVTAFRRNDLDLGLAHQRVVARIGEVRVVQSRIPALGEEQIVLRVGEIGEPT